MKGFQYRAPATLVEALSALAQAGPGARPLAGGTDLIVQLRQGTREANLLVDLKRIPELGEIRFDPVHGLTLGAAVPCADVAEHPAVAAHYPALVDGAGIIGGPAVRQRATVGGNLCNASPSGDAIPPLIVLDATCRIVGLQGERRVPVAAFCTGPGQSLLAQGELLVSLHLPPPQPRTGGHYLRFTPRGEMDIAVAGAAAWLALGEDGETIVAARLALGAVGPTPLVAQEAADALVGLRADEAAFERAAALARVAARPIDDVRGGLVQRRHLVGILVVRALRGALQRAKGEPVHA